ncbi:major facilitator superfamily domain-containing protein [Trichoderma evansii]
MTTNKDLHENVEINTTIKSHEAKIHYVKRGEIISQLPIDEAIDGFQADSQGARTLLTAEEEKKLLRRIDWHLMPLCSLIFMFKNLDSDNVSNARIMNQGTHQNIMNQLGMTSDEYNLVTVVYYAAFMLHDFSLDLVQAESGQFAGILLQMCYWYRPDEMSLRLLYFYICGNTSGIFGGLLAFAFDNASRSSGLSGWQWLFLTEGAVTVVFGIAVWFLLPDFPETASWLTDKEKAFIQARLPANAPRANEQNFKFSEIVDSLKDVRLWLFTVSWALFSTASNGVRFYQSTVIANLGFTNIATAQILNIPITAASLILIGVSGAFADNGRYPRPLYPLGCLLTIIACYAVLVAYPNNAGIYTATLIGNSCAAAWYPLMWPWRVQTTSRATGSAFSIGFVNSYGQIGGAIGPQIFRSKYAPHYTVPFAVAMALVALCMLVTLLTWWVTRNTERDTRTLKLARKVAEARNETILEDVVDRDLN